MTPPEPYSFEALEEQTRQQFFKDRRISRRLSYLTDMANLLKRSSNCLSSVDINALSARAVATTLLVARMSSDMLAMHRLCQIGYGAQACVLSRGIFEMGWTLTELCFDEALSDRWLELVESERDRNVIPNNIADLVKQHFARKGLPPDTAKGIMRNYSTLTSFVHANPRVMESHPEEEWEAHGTLRIGPNPTSFGIQVICAASDFCSDACHEGLGEYLDNILAPLQPNHRDFVVSELNRLIDEMEDLKGDELSRLQQ